MQTKDESYDVTFTEGENMQSISMDGLTCWGLAQP